MHGKVCMYVCMYCMGRLCCGVVVMQVIWEEQEHGVARSSSIRWQGACMVMMMMVMMMIMII